MKVVLVDDDSVYRFVGTTLIKRIEQIDISEFYEDGESAVEAIHAYDAETFPDFFFIDINMNAMDGWEVLDELQEAEKRVGKKSKIYIVSSSPLSTDYEKAEAHPAQLRGYILKPMGMEKLTKALQYNGEEFLRL